MKIKKVGIFIDAENVSYGHLEKIISESKKEGSIVQIKVYANFGKNGVILDPWVEKQKELNLLKICQVDRAINNKNNTDMFMALDIHASIYESNIDVYCIVSSDSDFIPLIEKIKNKNKNVILFYDKKKSNFHLVESVEIAHDISYKTRSKNNSANKKIKTLPNKTPKKNTVVDELDKIKNYIKQAIINSKKSVRNGKLSIDIINGRISQIYKTSQDFKKYKCKNLLQMLVFLGYKVYNKKDKYYIFVS